MRRLYAVLFLLLVVFASCEYLSPVSEPEEFACLSVMGYGVCLEKAQPTPTAKP